MINFVLCMLCSHGSRIFFADVISYLSLLLILQVSCVMYTDLLNCCIYIYSSVAEVQATALVISFQQVMGPVTQIY